MYQITHGKTDNLPDVADFVERLNRLSHNSSPELRQLFDTANEIFITRAPGRLDVMGGIADYSGSLVLEMPIAEATLVALQKDHTQTLKIVSLSENAEENLFFEMPLTDFENGGNPVEYQTARRYFENDLDKHWAAYAAGVFLVLMRECTVKFDDGAKILISSGIPLGKGVSSSAALEAAVMQAVCAAFNFQISPREMALLCQKVENLVVGAPCGIMDQMSVICGEENRLLAMLCQPAELQETIEIPNEIAFWGIDSGVRHSITGADYSSVRVGAFMGYRIIADLNGMTVENTKIENLVTVEDARWRGYLSNVTPSELEFKYAAQIPENISGAEFTARYGGTTDAVTQINPEKIYAVRVPTAHAVYEHQRVRVFAELLKQTLTERRLELLGELMFQSHASYAACGLCESGTNLLVEIVRKIGVSQGLYGAKITGGGSGGTVAVIGRRNSAAAISKTVEIYHRETGRLPYIFTGSSSGSAAFGFLKTVWSELSETTVE